MKPVSEHPSWALSHFRRLALLRWEGEGGAAAVPVGPGRPERGAQRARASARPHRLPGAAS
jgi:hypothetical protein